MECALCRVVTDGSGGNPAPLLTSHDAKCCMECAKVVIFVRMMQEKQPNVKLNRRNWIRAIRSNHPHIAKIRDMIKFV